MPSDPSTYISRRYHYRLTRADWAAYEGLPQDCIISLRVGIVVLGVTVGWYYERLQPWLPFEANSNAQTLVVGAAIAGLWFATSTLWLSLRRWRRVTNRAIADRDRIIEVFANHVGLHRGMSAIITWGSIKQIIVTAGHVFIIESNSDVLIMPLRAFESASEMAAYAVWVQQKIDSAPQ